MKNLTKSTVSKMSSAKLLGILRALRSNARHADRDLRPGYVAERDRLEPLYRTELDKRGVSYPKSLSEADWEIAIAKAMGFKRPQPQQVGKYAKGGNLIEVTEVWSDKRKRYVKATA